MRLLEVNGVSLLGASHQEAVNELRNAGDVIRLLVCDGYDAAEVERLQSEGKLIREAKSASESVCSLDRVGEEFSVSFRHLQKIAQRFKLFILAAAVTGAERWRQLRQGRAGAA